MSEINFTVRTCDICKAEIKKDIKYIHAPSYGAAFHYLDFHISCFDSATFLEGIKILDIDDIVVVHTNDDKDNTKLTNFNDLTLFGDDL